MTNWRSHKKVISRNNEQVISNDGEIVRSLLQTIIQFLKILYIKSTQQYTIQSIVNNFVDIKIKTKEYIKTNINTQ
jgi:hypothetical protein